MGINQLFRDPGSFLYAMLLTLPGIIIGLTFHEYAHAYVSYKLGDPTPKNQGRVTISRLRTSIRWDLLCCCCFALAMASRS